MGVSNFNDTYTEGKVLKYFKYYAYDTKYPIKKFQIIFCRHKFLYYFVQMV